jgi:hypothetical protein
METNSVPPLCRVGILPGRLAFTDRVAAVAARRGPVRMRCEVQRMSWRRGPIEKARRGWTGRAEAT